MASPTRVLKVRRRIKEALAGKARKNKVRTAGSTAANLPLIKPTANELAQAKKSN